MVEWVKFHRTCPHCLSPDTGLSSTECSHRWSGYSAHPYLGLVTRMDCDHVCKTPTADGGTQWPLMITEANQ